MNIDSATMAYNNRAILTPKALQGSGARIDPKMPIDRSSELYKQSQEFESIFVNMMVKEMRATVGKENDIMNGGQAEDIFSDMLYDEYSKGMTKASNFGLADSIYRQLSTTSTIIR